MTDDLYDCVAAFHRGLTLATLGLSRDWVTGPELEVHAGAVARRAQAVLRAVRAGRGGRVTARGYMGLLPWQLEILSPGVMGPDFVPEEWS